MTGPAPLFGKWAYGFWLCKNKYSSQEEILNVAHKYRELHIPVDNIGQDWFWWNTMGEHALEKDVAVSGDWGCGEATVWAEQMKTSAPDAETLMRYGTANGWLDGQPAVITRPYGKGHITYIGAVLSDKLMTAAAQWMVQKSGVVPALGPVPDGIEVCRREGAKALPGGGNVSFVDLPAYGVEVLLEGK